MQIIFQCSSDPAAAAAAGLLLLWLTVPVITVAVTITDPHKVSISLLLPRSDQSFENVVRFPHQLPDPAAANNKQQNQCRE